jgi:hypothetical protein
MIKEMEDSARRGVGGQFSDDQLLDASHLVIARKIPLQRGKWRLMPKGMKARQIRRPAGSVGAREETR